MPPRESFERDQVEEALRGVLSHLRMLERYLDGDLMAGAYLHDGAQDALHEGDLAREGTLRAAAALGFDTDEIVQARL